MTSIITKPKVVIDPKLLAKLEQQVHETGQVIVHCIMNNVSAHGMMMRIWPTTNLFDHHSDHVSNLVHAENISYFPVWQEMKVGDNYFTLIFQGLPKSCTVFDLIEDCQNNIGAFRIMNIPRNETDVYYAHL